VRVVELEPLRHPDVDVRGAVAAEHVAAVHEGAEELGVDAVDREALPELLAVVDLHHPVRVEVAREALQVGGEGVR
jgi:hypothetical protein